MVESCFKKITDLPQKLNFAQLIDFHYRWDFKQAQTTGCPWTISLFTVPYGGPSVGVLAEPSHAWRRKCRACSWEHLLKQIGWHSGLSPNLDSITNQLRALEEHLASLSLFPCTQLTQFTAWWVRVGGFRGKALSFNSDSVSTCQLSGLVCNLCRLQFYHLSGWD